VQRRFVDDPVGGMAQADQRFSGVIQARSYPIGDFETRATDISVGYLQMVENYRAAHAIALRGLHGQATTEELRQAMVRYRALFADLPAANSSPNDSIFLT
jgi:hypothetical protein